MKSNVQKINFLNVFMAAWFMLLNLPVFFVLAAESQPVAVTVIDQEVSTTEVKLLELEFKEKKPLGGLFEELRKSCDYSKYFVEDPKLSKDQNEVNKSLFMYEDTKLRAVFDVFKHNEDRVDKGYSYESVKKFFGFKKKKQITKESKFIQGLNIPYSSRLATLEVLDEKSRQDLEIIVGPKSNPKFSLAHALCRTSTELGRILFCDKLRKPMTDIALLNKQQAVVKELATNSELYAEFDKQFCDLQLSENAMLSLWNGYDQNSSYIQNFLFRPFYISILGKGIKLAPFADELNKVPALLELTTVGEFIRGDIVGNMFAIKEFGKSLKDAFDISCATYDYFQGKDEAAIAKVCDNALDDIDIFNFKRNDINVHNFWKKPAFWQASPSMFITAVIDKAIKDVCKKYVGEGVNKVAETVLILINHLLPKLYHFYYLPRHFKELKKSRLCALQKLMYLAKYLNSATTLIEKACKNPVLYNNIDLLKVVEEKLQKKSRDVAKILELLQSDTFKGQASMMHYFGRVVAAYNLLEKVKQEFVPLMIALGELDAQFSIARLYVEGQKSRVKYCFPTYLCAELGASISAQDFWNPVLGAEKAIANSLTLGAAFKVPRNAIITGPNAGGKSTTMKGFILNLIMAQTLGICAASEYSCTPCKVIMSYNNIVDDIAAGNSHFKAGVVRAKEVDDRTKSLQEHEPALVVADEIFNGSSHDESQAAACGFAKIVGNRKSVLLIMPTHFPQLTSLAKISSDWANYKVSVNFSEIGKIIYTYKLEPGVSNQNVAFKILKEEGFESALVEEAELALKSGKKKKH